MAKIIKLESIIEDDDNDRYRLVELSDDSHIWFKEHITLAGQQWIRVDNELEKARLFLLLAKLIGERWWRKVH